MRRARRRERQLPATLPSCGLSPLQSPARATGPAALGRNLSFLRAISAETRTRYLPGTSPIRGSTRILSKSADRASPRDQRGPWSLRGTSLVPRFPACIANPSRSENFGRTVARERTRAGTHEVPRVLRRSDGIEEHVTKTHRKLGSTRRRPQSRRRRSRSAIHRAVAASHPRHAATAARTVVASASSSRT
jgi:hypothetical protein